VAYKSWMEHSPSWRAKASAEGATRQRWDSWQKLSPAAQKATSQRDYATGLTVKLATRKKLKRMAFLKMRAVSTKNKKITDAILEYRLEQMTNEDLKWTADASLSEIKERASVQTSHPKFFKFQTADGKNAWWYR
jgi:hypothetical protein